VLAYREEYLVEHGFGRLKGKPLSLSPMYVQNDRRATGLVHLLSLGLRVLTRLQFRARQHLAESPESLPVFYDNSVYTPFKKQPIWSSIDAELRRHS
jgi:transposase